jgi:hypothetical protein
MEPNAKDTSGLLAKIAGGARSLAARFDDRARAAFEAPEETNARRAGMPTYSRRNPNPAWGDRKLGPGDRVVGRQVVSEGDRPFGQTISSAEWSAGNFDQEYASASSTSSEIGADFFAARQALADRRRR